MLVCAEKERLCKYVIEVRVVVNWS